VQTHCGQTRIRHQTILRDLDGPGTDKFDGYRTFSVIARVFGNVSLNIRLGIEPAHIYARLAASGGVGIDQVEGDPDLGAAESEDLDLI